MTENYIIRDYKKGDEEGITALFRNVFGEVMTIEQWRWKYSLPGEGRIYAKVAEGLSGEIIGHAGAIPLRGVFQNKLIQFFHMVDVMVHAKARGYLGRKSVFEKLCKNLYEDIGKEYSKVFCYGFSGTRPFTLGKRVGIYGRVEQAVECVNQLQKSRLSTYSIKHINWDDNRLDNLWEKLSSCFSLSIIRDKTYLHWRYATNPFFSYQLFGVFLLGRLKGWVVIRDMGNETLIVDFLFEKKRLKAMFTALENFLISRKRKSIRFWLPEIWQKTINNYTQKKTEAVVTNVVWKLPMSTAIAKENYFYTMGDVDIF